MNDAENIATAIRSKCSNLHETGYHSCNLIITRSHTTGL